MIQTTKHKTSIGGQALIEGVMMRGPAKTAMAVRKQDQTIALEEWPTNKNGSAPWYKKAPFVRGVFNFIDSLVMGYRCLMKSADLSGFAEEDEEPSEWEKKLAKLGGGSLVKIAGVIGTVLGILLAVALFMVLPAAVAKLIGAFADITAFRSVIEGVIKIAIFVIYLALISRMKDIRRVFEYHGAEHKTIACYEAGEELTAENVRKHSRFHPRCGTSFLLIVLIVSILVFTLVPWDSISIRVVLKILLLPLVVSIAYEIIKLAGRYDNIVTRMVSAPGLWLQRLTTREPDDGQIQVAIASLQAVIPENQEDDRW